MSPQLGGCNEIGLAIDWASKTGLTQEYPVTGFLTRHQGVLTDPLHTGPSE
jgi:hypothetical protein